MKYIFTLLLFFVALSLFANDTLTMRRVYTFSKGDTLDYKRTHVQTTPNSGSTALSFERYVVDTVYYNVTGDTLITERTRIYPGTLKDTISTTDLDSICLFKDFHIGYLPGINNEVFSDVFGDRAMNSARYTTLDAGWELKVAEGLGATYLLNWVAEPGTGYGDDFTTELIYFANDTFRYGIPYSTANGSHLLEFVPLPEECAIWTYSLGRTTSGLRKLRQFKTANRIAYNGHAYVELLYSYYDYMQGAFKIDSFVGYFRNDTINRKTLFYEQLSPFPYFEYNYNQLIDGDSISHIDSFFVNGIKRTRWVYSENYDQPCCPDALVAGLGSTSCLLPMEYYCHNVQPGPMPPVIMCDYGVLNCFELCGQILYTNQYYPNCAIINDLEELTTSPYKSLVIPNPAKDRIQITLPGNLTNAQLLIMDELGRIIYVGEYTPSAQLDISQWQQGVYFVRVYNAEKKVSAKFVKE